MYRITISKQADNDLRNIFEYITFSLLSIENATKQLKRLEESIKKLNVFPERFKQYTHEPWHSRGLRVMPVDNFCVFYIPTEKKVTIIRVLYNGRDIDTELINYTKY